MPEGYGVVVDVNRQSEPGVRRFNATNGYVVTGRNGWYNPPGDTGPFAKNDYNVIIITKLINKASAYIVFEVSNVEPEVLKKKLSTIKGEVRDMGTDEEALNPGDMVHITNQNAYRPTKVTLSFTRGKHNKPVAEFCFINHLVHPLHDPDNPAAPYLPYVSEIR
jgi:hypothetical protein